LGKTDRRLRRLSDERTTEIGQEVERLIRHDLAWLVSKYRREYRSAVRETFGWTTEDLDQEIRIALWKGLATFDRSHQVKVTTYLSATLHNLFANITKSCKAKKNQGQRLSRSDFMSPTQEPSDPFGGGESWMSYAESFDALMDDLSAAEMYILKYCLLDSWSIERLAKDLAVRRTTIIATILSIQRKMQSHLEAP